MNALYLSWRASAKERDRQKAREAIQYSLSHNVALWKDAPLALFLLHFCSLAVSPPLPPSLPSQFLAYIHTFTHIWGWTHWPSAALALTSIHIYRLWPSDCSKDQPLSTFTRRAPGERDAGEIGNGRCHLHLWSIDPAAIIYSSKGRRLVGVGHRIPAKVAR